MQHIMKKIRWGIVGPGNIAARFAQAVKNVNCAELVAVASREPERAAAFAETFDIPHVFCGYESMADSNLVDAIYIATPHPFHMPCAQLFLNAGKHVLCEKPMCVNARQAQELKDCAEKNGVFLMEAMWTRFLPAILVKSVRSWASKRIFVTAPNGEQSPDFSCPSWPAAVCWMLAPTVCILLPFSWAAHRRLFWPWATRRRVWMSTPTFC